MFFNKSWLVLSIQIGTLVFIQLGCQTASKKSLGSQAIVEHWEAKALVRNLQKNKSHVVNLDFVGQKYWPVRLEVTASMGFHLASLIFSKENVQYMLTRQKKYFYGPMSDKSLEPLLGVELEPQVLISVLYNEVPKEWSCQQVEQKKVCNTPSGAKLTWLNDDQVKKQIQVEGRGFMVQLSFSSYELLREFDRSKFQLSVPEDYKRYRLR